MEDPEYLAGNAHHEFESQKAARHEQRMASAALQRQAGPRCLMELIEGKAQGQSLRAPILSEQAGGITRPV